MTYTKNDHTFVVCAYKESEFLEECIQSLMAQKIRSKVIMTTSTDNEFIRSLAEKYHIPLFINHGEAGIAGDWNFGLASSDTPLITLAHQDDVYDPAYTSEMLRAVNAKRNILIYFTNYGEIREGRRVTDNTLLKIKRILLIPLLPSALRGTRLAKRLSLRFGNPVSCPSVTYVADNLPGLKFQPGFKSNIDWEEWEKLSRKKGRFEYNKKLLTWHRVHPGSETTNTIENGNLRAKEDEAMFRKFWPAWFARFLMKFYVRSEDSNKL